MTRVIYVPGLGDGYQWFRRLCLTLWRLYGVRVELFDARWSSDESLGDKQHRLAALIARYDRPILVGESAGATLCLQNMAADGASVASVVTLCGVCRPDLPIGASYQRKFPIFVQSVRQIPDNDRLDTGRIHCLRAWRDSSVPRPHSHVDGAPTLTLWSLGHLTTIFLALTLFAPFVVKQIRR